MDDIAIIGFGIIGKAVSNLLTNKKVGCIFPVDPLQKDMFSYSIEDVNNCKYAFVCVPTPHMEFNGLDMSIVEEVVGKYSPEIFIICSALQPGTVDRLSKKYNKRIVVQPEYFGETVGHPMVELNQQKFLILGGDNKDINEVIKLYQKVYNANIKIRKVTAYEAEIIKLSENRAIAYKVAQCQELYDACIAANVDYETIRQAVYGDDPRFNLWWTWVYEDNRGMNSKCVVPSTKIYTDSGFKLAEDIIVGDKVLTIDGSFQNVNNKFEREISENIIKIKPQGCDEFCLTEEHPVLAVKTNRKYLGKIRKKLSNFDGDYILQWINAKDLCKGDFVCMPMVKRDDKNILDDDLMRLIGYYIAEGYAKNGKITFGFNKNEKIYIDDIKSIVLKYFPIKKYRKGNRTNETNIKEYKIKNAYNLTLFNYELSDFLVKYGGHLHNHKKIHHDIFLSNNINQLLTGYFRGDGSCSDGVITIGTTSENLFYQVKIILLSFGISCTTSIKKAYISLDGTNHKNSYYIRIRNMTEIKKFNKICGSNINRNNKLYRNTTPILDNKILVPIRIIGKVLYSGKVYNYEIEKNNTYVINDAIVHNCIPKDIYGWQAWAKEVGIDPELTISLLNYNNKLLSLNK